jgi:hypothetical protein
MTPGRFNFTCPQGTTFDTTLTWKIENTPVDVSGYSARLQVRETYNSEDYIVNLTNLNGGITLGGSAGTINLLINATDTSNFVIGDHVYDLELISGNTTVTRLIEGRFNVTPEVTR